MIGALIAGFSALASVISPIASTIGSLATQAVAVAKSVTPILMKFGTKALNLVNMASDVVDVAGRMFGGLHTDDKSEDLGAKVKYSNLSSDDFDTREEYLNSIRGVELPENYKETRTGINKIADSILGMTLVTDVIKETNDNISISPDIIIKSIARGLNSEELTNVITKFNDKNISTDILEDYVNNKNLSLSDTNKVGDILEESLKDNDPNLSIQEIDKKILDLQNKDL